MRIDRVIQTHNRRSDYREKEAVYQELLEEYSQQDAMTEDFPILMELKWGIQYVPEKIGNSELRQKMEYSEKLREKTAEISADMLCTNPYSLKEYEHLSLLLDQSCNQEADKKNRQIAELLTEGSQKIRDRTFQELLKPLMLAGNSVLEGKTDEELVKTWEQLAPVLCQCSVIDKIITEAEQLGVQVKGETRAGLFDFFEKGRLPCQVTMGRAGIIANACYARLNDKDLKKVDGNILKKEAAGANPVLSDYLTDIAELSGHYEEHIRDQLGQKLMQLGYEKSGQAKLGNLRGKPYEYNFAVEVLKTGRPVYVIGENKKLLHTIEVLGTDGFLKPIVSRKQQSAIDKYMEDTTRAIREMLSTGQALSEDISQTARMYMAKMVCFQKLLTEKRMGGGKPGKLEKAIGNDGRKFEKAANMICQDERFQELTKDITIEKLIDFVNAHGEQELLQRYVQAQILENVTNVPKAVPKKKAEPVEKEAIPALAVPSINR